MSYKEYKVRVFDNGAIHWYNQEGQYHREDGPAAEYGDGSTHCFKNGQYHREDGPAVEYTDGTKYWFKNGQYHREDGPAVEYVNGSKLWYLKGVWLTEEAWKAKMNPVKEMTVQEISDMLGFEVKVVK